jgi:hypothetical protein
MWTALALAGMGDFATARTALTFLGQYQRADGKIPHEVSQSATLCAWFTDYPYAYASADATPLYLIAMDEVVSRSGEARFAKENWEHIARAYKFLRSTYDARGLASNFQVGHGWIEGGPLLPVQSELYQASLGVEGSRAFAHLAKLAGREEENNAGVGTFEKQKGALNEVFWSAAQNAFAYAIDAEGRRLETPSVLAAVPMWFGLLEESKAEAMIGVLANPEHQGDWGMRILSASDPRYNPAGYHHGSVWPLFTGWAAVGEYRYHRVLPAYENLRANAVLALDGSLGHVTEVLSGEFYEPLSYSSPQQVWSAAMVVSPLLRGLLGLEVAAGEHEVTFAPHIPEDWSFVAVRNVQVGPVALDMELRQREEEIDLDVHRRGDGECALEFAPAVSLRAKILEATVNGRRAPLRAVNNAEDQHATVHLELKEAESKIRIRLRDDFRVGVVTVRQPAGSSNEGLRFIGESWSPERDAYSMEIAGIAGHEYVLAISDARSLVRVEGGELTTAEAGKPALGVKIPSGAEDSYVHCRITFHFAKTGR